ncbi:MAG: hypothetical protein RLZZ453_266 [Chlamydiota bacterium]|jgi:hypothetical protein
MSSLKTLSPAVILRAVDQIAEWAEVREKRELPAQQISQVFHTLYLYAQYLITSQIFSQEEMKQGVRSLLALSLEAAERLERIQGKGTVSSLKEFQDLNNLYHHKVLPLFPKKEDEELRMGLSFKGHSDGILEGLHSVKEDRDYEFFLIRKEDGSSYVTPAMKAHIALLDQVNTLFCQEDSIVLKAALGHDRVCHEMAKQILKEKMGLIDSFYKEAFKFKHHDFIKSVNKALMALMLCANPRNLKSNSTGKVCAEYYQDFHLYLRNACTAPSKRREGKLDHFLQHVMHLKEELLSALFLIDLPIFELGTKMDAPLPLCKEIDRQKKTIADQLAKTFCGPLAKASDTIRKRKVGFDPLIQRTPLGQLYRLTLKGHEVSVLSLPAPVIQESVNKAVLAPEFIDFKAQLLKEGKAHLLINLQERGAWRGHARSSCLESAHDAKSLFVISLDRHTDFYHQSGPYVEWDDPEEFFKLCEEQMFSQGTGFFLAPEFKSLLKPLCKKIHISCFDGKERLTQKNRCDFIEILEWLFVIKVVEALKVDSLSFADKDGLDDASCMNTALWAICSLKNPEDSLCKEAQKKLFDLLFSTPLGLRGRVSLETFRLRQALEVLMPNMKNRHIA